VADDRFMLPIQDLDEGLLQALDARTMVIEKQKLAGIGRCVVSHRSKSNVSVQRKEGCVDTWGFKVKRGMEIEKRAEIFP